MKGDEFDIAVDPLEGTNFAAKNLPNALSVLAVARKGNLLRAPDIYMEKIAIGSNLPKKLVDLDFDVVKNIKLLSEAKNKKPEDLTVCILKRPRHDKIIKSLNSMNVKINFISDGDVSGVIKVAGNKPEIDMYIGIGGGPEGGDGLRRNPDGPTLCLEILGNSKPRIIRSSESRGRRQRR